MTHTMLQVLISTCSSGSLLLSCLIRRHPVLLFSLCHVQPIQAFLSWMQFGAWFVAAVVFVDLQVQRLYLLYNL